MPISNQMVHPGLILHEVIVGALRAKGTNFAEWCRENNVGRQTARAATFGQTNGNVGQTIVEKLINDAGHGGLYEAHPDGGRAASGGCSMNKRICAYELARSLLAEMPLWKRVEFLTGELLDINNLDAAAYAHNRLKMHCDDLVAEKFLLPEPANDQPSGGGREMRPEQGRGIRREAISYRQIDLAPRAVQVLGELLGEAQTFPEGVGGTGECVGTINL